ncbi:MAG: trypsin-like peptidase domain-containing protein [Pirellulales bacterium]|nr:trypsin-like peptidase domain-containing protein [Pirellulales bacterium]
MWKFHKHIPLACFIAGSFFFHPAGTLMAQTALPASLEQGETLSPSQRAELQAELRRHATVVEAQTAVLKTVSKLIGPTVVFIEAQRENRTENGRTQRIDELGSGVIIQLKDRYYVLTNRHVIRNAAPESIKINLADGRRIYPTKLWGDAEFDVGVLAISAPNLTPATLGDSDKLDIGDFVLAVGSPFGLTHSVTYGIISGKGRRNLKLGNNDSGIDMIQDFLQTDAAINPGNSGGPLVNLQGEVVGINTCIASNSETNDGIGFAIPSNLFMFVAGQLIETGKVTRAYIGVKLTSNFGPNTAAGIGLPRPMGALVNAITPKSPAAKAKLQPGDVILEFNHVPIEDHLHLINLVSVTPLGKSVPLLVYRDRRTLELIIEASNRDQFEPR